MKSFKGKKTSKKRHKTNARIHEQNEVDASNKVHHADQSKVKRLGKQKKVIRINAPGSGLAKWMLK